MTAPERLVAVLLIEGDDMQDIADRLNDLAVTVEEQPRATEREVLGGDFILTVRPHSRRALVEWHPGQDDTTKETA